MMGRHCCVTVGLVLALVVMGGCANKAPLLGAADFPATEPIERPVSDKDVGAKVLLLRTEYRLETDGRFTRKVTQRYRITTQEGVQGWGTTQAQWSPWYMDRPRISVTVTSPSGDVTELDQDTIQDASAYPDSPDVYSDARVLRAPLPNVVVGAVIEEVIEYKTNAPFPGTAYTHHVLTQAGVERERVELVVEAPASLDIVHELRDADVEVKEETTGGRRRLTFMGGPYPALELPEAFMPPDVPRWPHVAFTTKTSWNALAKYYGTQVDQRVAALSLEQVARDVAADAGSVEDKAVALLAWIRKRVRYTGIEFGESAIVPYAPKEVLDRGYGDCKDQSTLLVALLRGIGIKANVALLRAGYGEDVVPSLPALNAFNHAIVVIPDAEAPIWIDPSADRSRVKELPPSNANRLALVIDDSTESLVRTPAATSGQNTYRETRVVDLAEHGRGRITETSTGTGFVERALRSGVRGTPEQQREWAEGYADRSYYAHRKVTYETTDPNDLRRPFELTIGIDGAGVTGSSLFGSEVYVSPGAAFAYVPGAFRGQEDRKSPLFLPTPYRGEVRYVINPPEGMVPDTLPSMTPIQLGPVTLERELRREGRSIAVVFRLDFAKARWSAAEVNAFRKAFAEQEQKETLVQFVTEGAKHKRENHPRKALESYQRDVAAAPKNAVRRMRLALTLFDLRFAEEGRRQAAQAVELDPDAAFLHYRLGDLLARGDSGTHYAAGWNRDAAIAAMAKAVELNPDELTYRLDLAVLHEQSPAGRRYGPGSSLDEALRLYDGADQDALRGFGDGKYEHNALFALLNGGRAAEARQRIAALDHERRPPLLGLVAAAVVAGPKAALAEMDQLNVSHESRAQIIAQAAKMLVSLRHYEAGSALTKSLVDEHGRADPDTRLRLRIQQSVRRIDPKSLPHKTPFETVVRAFALQSLPPDEARAQSAALISKRSRDPDGNSSVEVFLGGFAQSVHAKTAELAPEVMGDFAAVTYEVANKEGDDASGYELRLRSRADRTQGMVTAYVVKEGGRYRIRSFGTTTDLGCEALHLEGRGQRKQAARWLDWARARTSPPAGDDPLRFPPFVVLWPKRPAGQAAPTDATTIRNAAAALCGGSGVLRSKVISVLEAARKGASKEQAPFIDWALLSAYPITEKKKEKVAVSRRLVKAHPDSITARAALTATLIADGRAAEALKLLERELKKNADDRYARYMIPLLHKRLGNHAEAKRLGKALHEDGITSAQMLNELAWMSLFSKAGVTDDDIAFSIAATKQKDDIAYVHTLASLYAEAGQLHNARTTLDRVLARRPDRAPDVVDHFVIGRLAEHLGLGDVARSAYEKVGDPAPDDVDSTAMLAKRGLKRLGRSPVR